MTSSIWNLTLPWCRPPSWPRAYRRLPFPFTKDLSVLFTILYRQRLDCFPCLIDDGVKQVRSIRSPCELYLLCEALHNLFRSLYRIRARSDAPSRDKSWALFSLDLWARWAAVLRSGIARPIFPVPVWGGSGGSQQFRQCQIMLSWSAGDPPAELLVWFLWKRHLWVVGFINGTIDLLHLFCKDNTPASS